MKAPKIVYSLLIGSILILSLFLFVQPTFVMATNSPSDIIIVTTSIQAAIDSANPGDIVQIPAGNYRESIVLDKAVSLVGAGSETTIIEARSSRRVIHIIGTAVNESVTISGLTVMNGNVGELLFLCPVSCGGGIMLEEGARPQMDDIHFMNNRATGRGGGLYADRFSTIHITNSEWSHNEAGSQGGGLYSANEAVVTNGRFSHNNSDIAGGGLTVVHTLSMTNTDFISNTATFIGGAGLVDGNAIIEGGQFQNNESEQRSGGALYIIDELTLSNASFTNNIAGSSGGAVRVIGNTHINNSTFINNTAFNDGGGLKVDSPANFSQLRFENNVAQNGIGGGIAAGDSVTMDNSILLDNIATNGGAFHQTGNHSTTITDSCVVNNSATSVFNAGSTQLVTTNVWWGANNGPSGQGNGNGDSVSANVAFNNFATASILGCGNRASGLTLYLPVIHRAP